MTREEKIKAIIEDTDKNYAPYYQVLPDLIRKHKFTIGIEIGVFCGGHAEEILKTGCKLIGIDPYKMYNPGMPELEAQEDWDLLYDLTIQRLSPYKYEHIRDVSNRAFHNLKGYYRNDLDFIFIDGLHTYDQLKKDLDNYSQLIFTGGVIACHDYNHGSFPELTTAIDEFVSKHRKRLIIGPLHLVYFYW